MDNKDFLKLVELLEKESYARVASEVSKSAEISTLNQMISDMQASSGQTIHDLNETIGRLLEENRLLKGPKKNSGNSSIPPSKDENRAQRTSSLRRASGRSSGGQKGHEGSTLKMSASPDHIIEHRPGFCNCCGLNLAGQYGELGSHRQVVDIPVVQPCYTEHRIFRKTCTCGHITSGTFPTGVDAPISYGGQTTALFREMLMQSIKLKKIIKPDDYGKPIQQRAAMEALLDELIRQQINPQHPEVITFQKRIVKHRDYLLTFLYHLELPSHNNSSEQAIRNVKVKLKVSAMFKSEKGAQNYAIIRSITDRHM